MALFKTLPPPTIWPLANDLLPILIMEVCLVLAPNVNFFLNSRKQGLPFWRSLSFFLHTTRLGVKALSIPHILQITIKSSALIHKKPVRLFSNYMANKLTTTRLGSGFTAYVVFFFSRCRTSISSHPTRGTFILCR